MSQPGVIDGLLFARGGEKLSGRLDQSQFQRLKEMRCITEGLSYELSGRTDAEGRCWLAVSVQGTLSLDCQRCLGPYEYHVGVDSELLLARSEQEIATAEDDIDRVLAAKRMSICELVEDEVLLALPMSPMHGRCAERQGNGSKDRDSPFSGLAKLKGMK
jgi:uncharacterized protein